MRHQGKAERDSCYEPMKRALEEYFEGQDRLHQSFLMGLDWMLIWRLQANDPSPRPRSRPGEIGV